MIVYINIGSNLGERKKLIQMALDRISEKFGICCLSSYIESEPWGFESDNRFLNLGVSFKSIMDPEKILREIQKIEKSISPNSHRDSDGHYIDRLIDIDIMTIDNMKYNSKTLTLPHPHLFERIFFLIPMQELNPEFQPNP